jgi:hypothetical protein
MIIHFPSLFSAARIINTNERLEDHFESREGQLFHYHIQFSLAATVTIYLPPARMHARGEGNRWRGRWEGAIDGGTTRRNFIARPALISVYLIAAVASHAFNGTRTFRFPWKRHEAAKPRGFELRNRSSRVLPAAAPFTLTARQTANERE